MLQFVPDEVRRTISFHVGQREKTLPGLRRQLGQCKQNGVRQNMDCPDCWLWGFVARILEWNERNNFEDDSFVDVY